MSIELLPDNGLMLQPRAANLAASETLSCTILLRRNATAAGNKSTSQEILLPLSEDECIMCFEDQNRSQ